MNKVIVMSGCSGSGKSTYAEKLLARSQGVKVSADHFFMGENGYAFDPSKLGLAHADCFRRFIDFAQKGGSDIIVDNTSLSEAEISPYMLAGIAYGYDCEIITFVVDLRDLNLMVKRNQHGVDMNVLTRQWKRLGARFLPPYWKNTNIPVVV